MQSQDIEIFEILENIIRNVDIEGFNIYDICEKDEKLQKVENADGSFSYKIFKNSILLKYYERVKSDDIIEVRVLDNLLPIFQEKFNNVKYIQNSLYARIGISNIMDIKKISNEFCIIFRTLFIQYIGSEGSFGCCSKYEQCSDNRKCINNNIRLRFGCAYKKNLDSGKIFYGKNKNI